MEYCEHKTSKVEKFAREFLGEKFVKSTEVCVDCGAALWDRAGQEDFSAWLTNLEEKLPRDKFTIQFFLSDKAAMCLEHLLQQFPGADKTNILRALSIIYCSIIAPHRDLAAKIEAIVESDVFKDISAGARSQKFKVQYKALVLVDLYSLAKLADLPPAKLVEEALLRMFAVCFETDPAMKEFWKLNILPKLELILKVA